LKIALIGSAPSSVRLAPYKDSSFIGFAGNKPQLEQHQFPFAGESWQIWGCSPGAFGHVERADRWFEMHRWEPGMPWFSPEYVQWLKAFKGPVYTTEVIPEVPNSTRIPRELLAQEFGIFFWTSSLSFMFAIAIMEIMADRARNHRTPESEPDEVGLWGVDMAATEEYGYQRAGCQFFIMEAQRRGIKVAIPPESDLARPMPMYGVSEWSHAHIKLMQRRRELQTRLQAAEAQHSAAMQEAMFLKGAIDDLEYMANTWVLSEHSPMISPTEKGKQVVYFDANRLAPVT
jgi:hypothetical protein